MAKRVYIGVGHGGNDNGAVANGFKEDDLNLAISLACEQRLKQYGIETKISRTTDKAVSIPTKVAESNAFKADVCVEIHNNAGGGDGFEIFHHHLGGNSKKVAEQIEKSVKAIGQNSRGLKVKLNSAGTSDYFGMIRDTDAPAVLVECAFIDTKDIEIIDTAEEQKTMGYAIADGVANYFGLKLKTNTTTIEQGSIVTIKNGAVYGGSAKGKKVPTSQLAPKKHTVAKVQTNNGVSEALLKEINSWVAVAYLSVETTKTTNKKAVTKGCKVKVKKGAKSYSGQKVASFIYNNVYTVDELKGKRAVLNKSGICTAFNTDDLIVQ